VIENKNNINNKGKNDPTVENKIINKNTITNESKYTSPTPSASGAGPSNSVIRYNYNPRSVSK